MQVYLVERSLKDIPMEQLAAAQRNAIRTAAQMTAEGTPIRYLRSTFVPESGECNCLFSAAGPEQVRALNERAGIPFDKVVAALDLTP